jgi:hypothetical protein
LLDCKLLKEVSKMSRRIFASLGALAIVAGLVSLAAIPLTAQSSKATAGTAKAPAAARTIPRTPWGAPDLNGIWTGNTLTPLERAENRSGRERKASGRDGAQGSRSPGG